MERERSGIALPLVGALLGAIIGGGLWALIAILTEYEIGLVAWAIGGMTGYAVAWFSKWNVNQAHQIISVVTSLLGIFLGKYFMFGYMVNNGIGGMLDTYTVTIFKENFISMFTMMDIVFVAFAVITAYQLPSKLSASRSIARDQSPAVE